MASQILTLAEFKTRPLEEILQGIVEQGLTVTVILPNGQEVVIASKPRLKPLPELEGYVPPGWK
ncbi:MAG TPA: hypothetical protein VIH59_32940, partial [Candidatus Tectomicrobia bacterium]